MSRRLPLVALILGLAVFAGARLLRPTAASSADAALAEPPEAVANVVSITARDFAFEAPDTIPAGLTSLQLHNGGTELHHVQLVRLEDGKTVADFAAAMESHGPPPAWMVDVGGPNSPPPGGQSSAKLVLTPGNYVLICFIPSPDGKPHIMKGMLRPLVVAGEARPARLPKAEVSVILADYDFRLSRPLVAGKQVLTIRNEAAQSHEMFIAKLAPGKTAADLLAWVEKMQGPPPGEPAGGITGLAHGAENQIELDLTPGEYALFCFLPDAGDGKPHVAHGMVKQVRVE